MDGISEIVSENRKRGRPRLTLPEWDAAMRGIGYVQSTDTRRTITNKYHRLRAIRVLSAGSDPRFSWLVSPDADISAGRGKMRHTILAKLGRIADDELLLAVAEKLCSIEPGTRDAVARIRRVRHAGGKQADALDLANEIIATINDYSARYPGTTAKQIEDAIRTAWGKVEEAEER
jgi:hypothetical protein